jgi:hypothetical protein
MAKTKTKKSDKDENYFEITSTQTRKVRPEVLLLDIQRLELEITQLESKKTQLQNLYNELTTNT